MQQAGNDGSRSELVTREQIFCGPVLEPEKNLFTFRAGIPVDDALEHALNLVDSVQRSLEQIASDANLEIDGTLWSLSYVLENAKGAIYACLGAANRIAPATAGRA